MNGIVRLLFEQGAMLGGLLVIVMVSFIVFISLDSRKKA